MTFAYRRVKGFVESQQQAVERLIEAHCFGVSAYVLPGELEVGIAYEPGCAERWDALAKDLQEKISKDIRIV